MDEKWLNSLQNRMKTPEQRQAEEAQAGRERSRLDQDRKRETLSRAMGEIGGVLLQVGQRFAITSGIQGENVGIGGDRGRGLWFCLIDGAVAVLDGDQLVAQYDAPDGPNPQGHLLLRTQEGSIEQAVASPSSPRRIAQEHVEKWLARTGKLRS